jgi:hypothetical protein
MMNTVTLLLHGHPLSPSINRSNQDIKRHVKMPYPSIPGGNSALSRALKNSNPFNQVHLVELPLVYKNIHHLRLQINYNWGTRMNKSRGISR